MKATASEITQLRAEITQLQIRLNYWRRLAEQLQRRAAERRRRQRRREKENES